MNVRKTCARLLAFCSLLLFGIGCIGSLVSTDSTDDITRSYKGVDDVGTLYASYGLGDLGALYHHDTNLLAYWGADDVGTFALPKGVGEIGS